MLLDLDPISINTYKKMYYDHIYSQEHLFYIIGENKQLLINNKFLKTLNVASSCANYSLKQLSQERALCYRILELYYYKSNVIEGINKVEHFHSVGLFNALTSMTPMDVNSLVVQNR